MPRGDPASLAPPAVAVLSWIRLAARWLIGGSRQRRGRALALRRAVVEDLSGVRPKSFSLKDGVSAKWRGLDVTARSLCAVAPDDPHLQRMEVIGSSRLAYSVASARIAGPTGIILHGGEIIGESGPCFGDPRDIAASRMLMEEDAALRSGGDADLVEIPGSVHHTGAILGQNYYHWLIDTLPRLLWALRAFPDTRVVMPRAPKFALDLLDVLGIPHLVTGSWLRAERAVVVDRSDATPLPRREDVDIVISSVRGALDHRRRTPRRRWVYVSRVGSTRSLRGEEELERDLARAGFEIFRGGHSGHWADQFDAFRDAEVIAGPHGAGLSNLIFSPTTVRVVELVPRTYSIGFFRDLCRIRGVAHCSIELAVSEEAPFGSAAGVARRILGAIA